MKNQRKVSRKEKTEKLISRWAFIILFALSIQFLVYLAILNFSPTIVRNQNGEATLNPLYYVEKYYVARDEAGNALYGGTNYDNGTRIIYFYNIFLLLATIVLTLYYLVNFMENSEGKMIVKIKSFLKKQWPLTLLLIFMIWVFISSILAYDTYRSFIGCFNLKDGYFSFMMYASMLVCSILMGKDEKYRKIIVNTFLITATILAAVTLWNYEYLTSDKYDGGVLITSSAKTIGEMLFGNGGEPYGNNFLIVSKRIIGEKTSGIFHNSNHYGYYLSICVIVAAIMFVKEKKVYINILYLIAYAIMLRMAIINNTFGAYLGISASLIFLIIYAFIPKEDGKINKRELAYIGIVVAMFAVLSATTVNEQKQNIVEKNFSGIYNDFKLLVESKENGNTSNEDKQNNIESGESNTTTTRSDVDNIGSGRGILWQKALVMAFQRPLFGYGLENIKYVYDEQFGINEGRSHNLILQLAATTGIVGMLLYVVGIASIWVRKLKTIKKWDVYECLGMFVIVSYIVSSFFGNSGFYTSGYFYIFVGFVAIAEIPESTKLTIDKKKK